jgi:hypothetical protein
MNLPDFKTFEADALARGFDEVAERAWPADALASTHTHPFSVEALVVQGEMWLTSNGSTRHLVPGDSFQLGAAVEHAERYGPEGATFWAARRHGPGAG